MKKFRLKIRAGETFLYRKDGTESQVFELRLNHNLSSFHLIRAAKLTYKRYPYFKSRFKLKDGSVYLCENVVSPAPQRLKRLRPLGSLATSNNLLDITFYKNRLFISFHHAMCDGKGIMNFIKTLLYYYLNFKFPHNNVRIPDVRLSGENFLKDEFADPVADGNFEFDKSKVFQVSRDAFAIPQVENGLNAGEESFKCELIFENDELARVSKENNCTPVILMCILMQKAVQSLNPTNTEPVLCNMSCDWRESIGLANTFRNCVSSIYLPYGSTEQGMSNEELGKHFRNLVAKQKEVDSARCSASVMKFMSDMLDSLGEYEKKQATVSGFTSKPINSFIASYTGRAMLGDAERYVEEFHVYSSGTKGISLQMMSVANNFTVDVLQNFESEIYIEELLKQAELLGLKARKSSIQKFRTPKDNTFRKNKIKKFLTQLIPCR